MVALLVSMAVAAVWMTTALPSWRQQVTREKEAELIFRGESIARAIYLYQRRNGGALPPSLDALVAQKFLRRKYKDPIADKDFLPVGGAAATPGGVAPPSGVASGPGRGGPQAGGVGPSGGGLVGGIVGVRSTSNAESIRIYNNQQTYSQWAFDFTLEQLRSGTVVPGGGITPGGGRGGPGIGGPGRGIGPGGNPVAPGGGRGGPTAPGELNPIVPRGGGPGRGGAGAPPPPFGAGGFGGRGR